MAAEAEHSQSQDEDIEIILIRRLQDNDESALEDVLKTICPKIRVSLAKRLKGTLDSFDLEEIIGTILLKLWIRRETLNPDAATLTPYLAKMAMRRAIDVIRSKMMRVRRHESLLGDKIESISYEELN